MVLNSKLHSKYPLKLNFLARHALSHFMCFLLVFQPLLLQAGIDASRSAAALQQLGVETAVQGVPRITFDASRLSSQAEMTLRAAGKVALLTNTNTDTDYEQKKRREESALWWSESDKGQVKERIQHVEMEAGGGLKIDAGGGIVVEYEKTGDFQSSIEQLAESPGLSWMGQLKSDPRVDWAEVESRFDSWDYESQGLTEAGAALVSLVAAAASGGALSNLSGSLAQGLGYAADGAVQAALQTGLSTLTRQVSVTLINHQGDIGATLDSLGSSDALRSLATAMVASGLIVRVSDATNLGVELTSSAPLADRVVQDLHRGLLRATVNAGASALVEGGRFDESFVAALRQESAAVIGENVAQKIGIAARSGDIDTTTQIIAHAALGCVTGAVAADDCGSGAIGGAVGETIGLILLSDKRAEAVGSELGAALQKGELTPEEARELAYQWQQQGVDLSKLAAGLSAALVGGNVDVAANTAENAVENNALCGGLCIGAFVVIGALWTTDDVAKTYEEEGGEAALKQLAVDGVITVAALGSGKVVYKVGKITYKSAAKAYQAAKEAGLLRGVTKGVTRFKHRELFEHTIKTKQGPVDFLAETVVKGDTLILKDVAVFGRKGNEALTGLQKEIFRGSAQLKDFARQQGFKRLEIQGTRVPTSSSARPGHDVNLGFDL